MTVLYDTAMDKIISNIYTNGYKVDGIKPELPNNILELNVIKESIPTFDEKTQKIISNWIIDLNNFEYRLEHTVENLSEYEIAMKDWEHPEYSKRIVAPKQLVMEDIGIKMLGWFQVNGFPIQPVGNTVHLYCNVILQEHEDIVATLQDIIQIEEIPQNT